MEWVKLHLSWADGLQALTDDDDKIDEAACGRFFLGLLQYIQTGEKPKLTGPEKVLFAMAVADLKKDYTFFEKAKSDEEAKKQAISEARRDAANARWSRTAEQDPAVSDAQNMQTDANACKPMQEHTQPSSSQQSVQIAPIKNKDIRKKNIDKDKEIEKEKNIKKKEPDANGLPAGENKTARPGRQKPVTESQYDQRPNTYPDGYGKPKWLTDAQNRRREQAGRQKTVTEAQYYQRPNTEPDGDAVPQWLTEYEDTEITGYSDPAGNPDAPDRPDIHGEE